MSWWETKKLRELLYVDHYYFLNGWDISVLVKLIFDWCMNVYSKYNFLIFNSFYMLVSLCYNLQSHYTFFQVHQIPSGIIPILYNKPCLYTWDWYIWKRFKFEWSFPKILISSLYAKLIVENTDNICWKKNRGLIALHFKKNILTRIFFKKISDTRGLWPLRHIFNKVTILLKIQISLRHRIGLVDDY